jgi:hypothetical protein
MGAAFAAESTLYLSPDSGAHSIGDMFDVRILADSGGIAINAAEADLTFNQAGLSVQHIATDESILGSWSTNPTFSNQAGVIRFAGWTSQKRVTGSDLLLAVVTFKVLRNIPSDVRFSSGALLSADEKESNILTGMRSGVFMLAPAEQASKPLLDQSIISAPRAPVIPLAPVFAQYPESVNAGSQIVIKGRAAPGAQVIVRLARESEHEDTTTLVCAPDGSFTFVSDKGVRAGTYHVWATVMSVDGIESVHSDTIDIVANPLGLVAAASAAISYTNGPILYWLLIVTLSFTGGYQFHRRRMLKQGYKV